MSGVQIRCKIREEKWIIRVTWAGVKNGMDPLPHNNLTLAAGHDAEAIFTEPLWGGEAHKILIAVLLFLLINRIKVFMLVPKEVLALLQRVQADYLNPVGGVTRALGWMSAWPWLIKSGVNDCPSVTWLQVHCLFSTLSNRGCLEFLFMPLVYNVLQF